LRHGLQLSRVDHGRLGRGHRLPQAGLHRRRTRRPRPGGRQAGPLGRLRRHGHSRRRDHRRLPRPLPHPARPQTRAVDRLTPTAPGAHRRPRPHTRPRTRPPPPARAQPPAEDRTPKCGPSLGGDLICYREECRKETMRTSTDLDAGERMSLDELRADQLRNLRSTVTTVYENVPFYRMAFDELGVTPADITSLEDIAKLPFTNKQDLRDNYPFGMFAVPQEQVARIHASSGTTGLPTVVGYTTGDLDNWGSLIARSILGAGGKRGQMMHNAYGYGLFTGGLGVHGAERHGFTVVPISGGQTPRQVQLIQDFKPDS